MTESTHKKPREGRYHVNSHGEENEPLFEPLADLDADEDAIDRLLINTGFDDEEAFAAPGAAQDDHAVVQTDRFEADQWGDDAALSALNSRLDDEIEPVDLGSPVAEFESFAGVDAPINQDDKASFMDELFWASDEAAAEFSDEPLTDPILPVDADDLIDPVALDSPLSHHDPLTAPAVNASTDSHDPALSARPAHPDDEIEPVDLDSPLAGIDRAEASNPFGAPFENHGETMAYSTPPSQLKDAATTMESAGPSVQYADTQEAAFAQDLRDEAAFPDAWSRLLARQEDTRQQIERLEQKTRHAGSLSYAALAVSVAALCAALAAGYLTVQTRAEQTKLKEMPAVLRDDMNGVNEKVDSNQQAAEERTEISGRFADEANTNSEATPFADAEPRPPKPEPIQAAVKPAKVAAGKKASVPVVRNMQTRQLKPAFKPVLKPVLKSTLRNPSATPAKNAAGSHWTVNLASFRQMRDARRKAAEFRQKGIAVNVKKVDIEHSTWYRLSVPGFKTRQAASTQSTRLKKLLRLHSIWVAAI